jgi:septum formation protein
MPASSVPPPRKLVLASGSPYRKDLLAKLGLPFETASSSVDESPERGETNEDMAVRLARKKADALSKRFPKHLIIGSDQIAVLSGQQLTKPGGRDQAIRQLRAASGRAVTFYTGVCVLDSETGDAKFDLDRTIVHFRTLTDSQIEHYVDKDRPFDCAGSFKSESLGIALFEKMETEDPNAVIGLPLVRLIRLLEAFGVTVI